MLSSIEFAMTRRRLAIALDNYHDCPENYEHFYLPYVGGVLIRVGLHIKKSLGPADVFTVPSISA